MAPGHRHHFATCRAPSRRGGAARHRWTLRTVAWTLPILLLGGCGIEFVQPRVTEEVTVQVISSHGLAFMAEVTVIGGPDLRVLIQGLEPDSVIDSATFFWHVLALAVDSAAPLLEVRLEHGATGEGRILHLPLLARAGPAGCTPESDLTLPMVLERTLLHPEETWWDVRLVRAAADDVAWARAEGVPPHPWTIGASLLSPAIDHAIVRVSTRSGSTDDGTPVRWAVHSDATVPIVPSCGSDPESAFGRQPLPTRSPW